MESNDKPTETATENTIRPSTNETLYETMAFLASKKEAAYKKGPDGIKKVGEIEEVENFLKRKIFNGGGEGQGALFLGDDKKNDNTTGGGTDPLRMIMTGDSHEH
jgi:hypothetical protein